MRPLFRTFSLVLLGLALTWQAGYAQDTGHRYRWVDGSGLPHYSDSLSVKALKYGYDVLGSNGHVLRHVDGQLSHAERQAAATRAARAQSSRNQRRHDRQLLTAYPTEASFKSAQQARIDRVDEHIQTTRTNLDSQEQTLAQLLDQASDYSAKDEDVPDKLAGRIASQRKAVDAQRRLLKHQRAHKADVRKQVTAELAHYRALQGRSRHDHP